MDKETFNIAKEVADLHDINYEVYTGYSGRCMYGRTTDGLTVESFHDAKEIDKGMSIMNMRADDDFFDDMEDEEIISFLRENDEYPERENEFANFRIDNMGLDFIIY